MTMLPKDIETLLLDSLRDHPEDWREYRIGGTLYHVNNDKLSAEIWMANGYYGMGVKFPEIKFGGVIIFGWLVPWRVRLRRAVVRMTANDPDSKMTKLRARLLANETP